VGDSPQTDAVEGEETETTIQEETVERFSDLGDLDSKTQTENDTLIMDGTDLMNKNEKLCNVLRTTVAENVKRNQTFLEEQRLTSMNTKLNADQ
jgi:hypothetical protein